MSKLDFGSLRLNFHTVILTLLVCLSVGTPSSTDGAPGSRPLTTNETRFSNAPEWLSESRINRVVDSVQRWMEWDIRRIEVLWFDNGTAFERTHGFGPSVLAVSMKAENSIFLGPRVNTSNFDAIFGHELVHMILFQKYKKAIPSWLEEGLANWIAKRDKADYAYLATQPTKSVRSLVHPFLNKDPAPDFRYHYQASTALAEMLSSKCQLRDLLQLSVGEKLEGYLTTFCRIPDIDEEFKKWIKNKRITVKR
jgi:hypothetical protein